MDLTSSENSELFLQASDIRWKGTPGGEQYGRMTVEGEDYSAEGEGTSVGRARNVVRHEGGD